MLPERIGRYDVRGLAGSGGFATVYEGFDPRLDARVAIKVLADNWSSDPEIRRRFRQEAVLLRRLQTEQGVPGLVEVFDVDQTEIGQPFFVMGWAGGGTLGTRAGRTPWPSQQLVPVITAMTQSLGHLHSRGVVHRDIKPQNLLLRSDRSVEPPEGVLVAPGERLVVGDFGLAKDLAADASTLSFVGGTERYMAPEQLVFGGRVDHRADIFAATAMVNELLTGRGQVAIAPELVAAVQKGTATDPADRFATMTEWQTVFLQAIESSKNYVPEPDTAVVRDIPRYVGGSVATGTEEDPPTEAPSPGPSAPPAPAPALTPAPVSAAAPTAAADPSVVGFGGPGPGPGLKPAEDSSKKMPLLAGVGVLGAVAVAALLAFLFLRGGNDVIVGPSMLESGETVTYRIDDSASTVVWTDPSGARSSAPTLDITGRLPGRLEFSAVVDGTVSTRTVIVEESSLGPQIEGPETVPTGEQGVYRVNVPVGHTFFWLHPTDGAVSSQELSVTQTGEEFVVGAISVGPDGVERGDQILVSNS